MNRLFGQYAYKNTIMHKLDPRIKIILVVLSSIFLFLINSYFKFLLISTLILFTALTAKIKLKNILKNLRPFLFFFIFILLMYYFFSKSEFDKGIMVVWRFTLLVIIASILTFTTSISQLVYAIERLFLPLKILKISSRNIAIMVSTTVRFIPLLFLETNKIRDAQKSRMAGKKIRNIIGLVAALLRKTFNKANNLADAIESRCYRDHSYTNFREFKTSFRDYIALLIVMLLGVLIWI